MGARRPRRARGADSRGASSRAETPTGGGGQALLCQVGWHQWIVLPLQEPDFWLERVCLRCGRRERLVADRWGLSLDWQTSQKRP